MTEFSEDLNEKIKKKKMKISWIAKEMDVDRTVVQKVTTGSRKPPDKEFVDKISKVLMLSPYEKDALMEKYKMLKMGEQVYKRRKNVEEIINYLSHKTLEETKPIDFSLSLDVKNIPEVTTYNDESEFLENVQILVTYDYINGSDLNIMAQPSKNLEFVLKYCKNSVGDNAINHLFCLDNSPLEENSLQYNLNMFGFTSEMAFEHSNYNSACYYGNVESSIHLSGLFPNTIITDNFVICADTDFTSGVIYHSKSQAEFYLKKFRKEYNNSGTMIKQPCSEGIFIRLFEEFKNVNVKEYSFNFHSEIISFIDESMIEKYSLLDENQEQLKYILLNVNKNMLKKQSKNIFSERGLEYFMKYGKLLELPEELYKTIEPEDRKILLERLIESNENDLIMSRILKSDKDMFRNKTCLGISEDNQLVVQLSQPMKYIMVEEPSIVFAFKDYIGSLFESDDVYNKDETIAIMKKYL